jgi:Mg-chelatase subunit ChlD
MRKGLTEIVLVLDRSGSMQSIKHDAEGGLRSFVSLQRNAPGEARLTFYRFDDTTELVFEDRDIRWIKDDELRLDPRASTALLDAMGRAIKEVGARLASRREEDRPEHVVFLTVTDGEENSSKEYPMFGAGFRASYGSSLYYTTKGDGPERIAAMIKEQREKYNWQFVFIGCTEEALKMARDLGYTPGLTLSNAATGQSYGHTYSVMASNITAMRSGGGIESLSFTDSQRAQVLDDDNKNATAGASSGGNS